MQPDRDNDSPVQWRSPPDRCSYLPEETASLNYRQLTAVSAADYEALLERGWRRHGVFFFRPACPTCVQCRSLRVSVAEFQATKSQRRCWRRNAGVRVELARPSVSRAHLELFNGFHADMHQRRGWPFRTIDASEYATSFLLGRFDFAYELRYFRGGQLIGVGLMDITPRCSSSCYFYHEPAWRPAGPGVFSMLVELQLAAQEQLAYHHLGYWIAGCGSMAYKSQYHPHELLKEFVGRDQLPQWERETASKDGSWLELGIN
jgi:arginyl-tRNA--protein-N-Asp/Glu arginylyltransferase